MKVTIAILLAGCFALPAFGQSREYNGELPRPRTAATDQIIVKWRAGAAVEQRAAKLRAAGGATLQRKLRLTSQTDVVKLERAVDGAELDSVIAAIAADPDVEYAVADQWRSLHAVPTDPLFIDQWYFGSAQASATRAQDAWDVTTGSNTTIVAVLDTGARYEHPDLGQAAGKILPGHDFVTNTTFSNDADGRDTDASDPGDFITDAEAQTQPFTSIGCGAELSSRRSSWHGTRVASLIAAQTNNNEGIAGTGWDTRILPVRVMAKCGGTDSDIIAGMRWAAGLPVFDVTTNLTPAKVLNLSLGGTGTCSVAYQQTINEITAQGVVVVISVGNEGRAVSSPANCNGVIAVAALRHVGSKVGFSNLGPNVTIGAPGGNCVNPQGQPCLFSLVAATNAGDTTPGASTYTDKLVKINVGTSFAAPLVAGAAALMHAVNGQITPAHYATLLRESAAPFPTTSPTTTTVCQPPSAVPQGEECICTTQTCGAGMLNTHAAVLAAQRPFAAAQGPTQITAGTDISIDGSTSVAANGRTIVSHQWSAVGVTGAAPAFVNPAQAATTYQVSGDSQFTLRLTVTDDLGTQDTADIPVSTAAPQPPPPPPPPAPPATPPVPRGGGGGGSIGFLLLALAVFGAFLRQRSTACRPRASAPGRPDIR